MNMTDASLNPSCRMAATQAAIMVPGEDLWIGPWEDDGIPGDKIVMPANSDTDAANFLATLYLREDLGEWMFGAQLGIGYGHSQAQAYYRIRLDYVSKLDKMYERWKNSGQMVNKQFAYNLMQWRNGLRLEMQQATLTSTMAFKVINPLKANLHYLPMIKKKLTPLQKWNREMYKQVILGATKNSPSWTNVITKTQTAIAKFNTASQFLWTIEIPYYAYAMYNANSAEQEQKAFQNIVSTATTASAATLCVATAVGTMGAGFLICGAASYAAGKYAGQFSDQLFNFIFQQNERISKQASGLN